ncbi:MAG: MazG nucleotide pyrophosphohydrolase domain-containing protein [Tissierellia bacterium]|nr:MazG nucleotide pyrophosphohydrolase domain-containing protein [Tissierellia bacterium]
MGRINIVGLGPAKENLLTQEAVALAQEGRPNLLRTGDHGTVAYFIQKQIPFVTYDSFYDQAEDFEEVYQAIVKDLIDRAQKEDINYFVPGHPLVAERTVKLLLESGADTRLVHGLSFIEPVLALVEKDPVEGLLFLDGDNFRDLDLNIHKDTLITQVYNQRVLSDLKLAISEIYGDHHPAYLIIDAGLDSQKVLSLAVYELDRVKEVNHQTSLYLPRVEEERGLYDLADLIWVVRRLRGPEGCPWDRVQTHQSMKGNLIEEAYEAVHAIGEEDPEALVEELGDVLYQVVFHSELARERGDFRFEDVTSQVTHKMISRHPHVFAGYERDWNEIKYEAAGIKTLEEKIHHLQGFPSLLHGQKLLRLIKSLYQDFEIQGLTSLEEEVSEKTLGDSLLKTIILAENEGIDLESACKAAIDKVESQVLNWNESIKDIKEENKNE